MYNTKEMSVEDLDFAVSLSDTMGWDMVDEDFKLMMNLEPEGCAVLLDDSERIGIATAVSYGRVGWIGNVILRESRRGRGGGSFLVKHLITYLTGKGVKTIGLYAYPERVRFYERLGFKYDSEFVVLKGEVSPKSNVKHVRKAKREDIPEIINLDSTCFGASRRRLLEPMLLNHDNICHTVTEDKQVSAFILAKVYDQFTELGPLVCQREKGEDAIYLLESILNMVEGYKASICIPERELALIEQLMKRGLRKDFHPVKMFYGNPIANDCIYAVESVERG